MPHLTINDIELHYEEQGSGPEPIVFIHGFLCSSRMWLDDYMKKLPDRYHSFAIDVRGHGRSHKVKSGANLPRLAQDVYELVRQLELGPSVFVGFSMGGAICAQLVLDHPEVVRALVLSNPGLGSTISGFWRMIQPVMPMMAQRRWLMKRSIQSMVVHSHSEEEFARDIDEAMLVSRETWAEYLHPDNKISDLSRFKAVKAPTLVMIGSKDSVLPLDMQHQLAAAIPKAEKIVFENEGHIMATEAPDLVREAMWSFLEEKVSRA